MGKNIFWVIFFLLTIPSVGAHVDVSRDLDVKAVPGGEVDIALSISVSGVQEGLIITEVVPEGWKASGNGIDKREGREIKWLFNEKSGVGDKEIEYTLKVPESAKGKYLLKGYWSSIDSDGDKNGDDSGIAIIDVSVPERGSSGSTGSGGKSSKSGNGSKDEDVKAIKQKESNLRQDCLPGSVVCKGGNAFICSGSGWDLKEECSYGCLDGNCVDAWNQGSGVTGSFLSFESGAVLGIAAIVIIGFIVVRKRSGKQGVRQQEKFRYEFRPSGEV